MQFDTVVNSYILGGHVRRERRVITALHVVFIVRGRDEGLLEGEKSPFVVVTELVVPFKTTCDSPCVELVVSLKTTELAAIAATAGERAC